MKQLIQFKKQRDLGAILNDTFSFLRHEYKPFFALILQITLPYLILFFVGLGFLLFTVGDFMEIAVGESSPLKGQEINFVLLIVSFLVLAIAGILVFALSNSTTIHYIKSYIKNNGEVNTESVKKNVKDTFWSFVGLSTLKWIAIFFGFMLCFLPGVYLIVPMSVVFCIMVFEKKTAMDAFSDSFKFIKDKWWITFLVLLVIGILIAIIGGVLSIPATIYSYIKMGIFSGEFDPELNPLEIYKDPVYIVLNLINYAFRIFLNFITLIATVFIYFNINEKKNFSGTFEQIDALGKIDK